MNFTRSIGYTFLFYIIISFIYMNQVRADFNSGIDAAALTIQYMMADPPLPHNDSEMGKMRASIKPGYITGDTEANYDYGGGNTANQAGSVNGFSIGGVGSYTWSAKWSSYAWLVGTRISGDFDTKQNGEATASIRTRDVDVTFFNLSFGMNYQIRQKSSDTAGISVFFGPYFPYFNTSQRYINDGSGFDGELESNELFAGLLVGVQLDMDLAENWRLGPFIILGDTFGSNDFFNPFGDTGECKSFEATAIRSGSLASGGFGEVDCGNRQEFLYDTMIGGMGLNLGYKPWGLSANIFSPFLNQLILKLFYEDEEPDLFYLSFTWDVL